MARLTRVAAHAAVFVLAGCSATIAAPEGSAELSALEDLEPRAQLLAEPLARLLNWLASDVGGDIESAAAESRRRAFDVAMIAILAEPNWSSLYSTFQAVEGVRTRFGQRHLSLHNELALKRFLRDGQHDGFDGSERLFERYAALLEETRRRRDLDQLVKLLTLEFYLNAWSEGEAYSQQHSRALILKALNAYVTEAHPGIGLPGGALSTALSERTWNLLRKKRTELAELVKRPDSIMSLQDSRWMRARP